jgi:hypothetical protein
LQAVPAITELRQALAGVMSEIHNISPTRWGTLIEQNNQVYHFDSAF